MAYAETKIYFDGSHYIGIPHTTRPNLKRYIPPEEEVEVKDVKPKNTENENENVNVTEQSGTPAENMSVPFPLDNVGEITENNGSDSEPPSSCPPPRRATRKQLFEEAYKENIDLPRKKRQEAIYEILRPYFRSDIDCESYVQVNMERKARNIICRRIRMTRKANLANFNYFCTFTYDSKLHDEESFRKGLKTAFRHLCNRKGWKYMGVWERSPEKKRLHFHGLFNIPDGAMPESCEEKTDYNFHSHKRVTINQNTYFLRRFGRNDFEPIDDRSRLGEALAYLMKYIEKSGEKIVYSKGLPQYFISDILEDDVVTRIGLEDRKLLLFDDFRCFDEGEYKGVVSPAVIKQLRTVN